MMKRGAKRPALSSDSGPIDSSLPSKRVMEAPSFGVDRAESSCQHLGEGKPLDAQRAELSRQHVRALNTQFASWAQLQLQTHPDELWEDGVKDYLSHAAHIKEKFKDVVDWLRANAAKPGAAKTVGLSNDKNSAAEMENSRHLLKSEPLNGFTRGVKPFSLQSSGLSNSHNLVPFSSSQISASSLGLQNSLSGSQNSVFSLSKKPVGSSLQSSGLSGSQTTGFFNSQFPASSSMQSSGLSGSQTSGFFNINQSPASSSLQSSGLSGLQPSSPFTFGQSPPASSIVQSSGSSGSQSSGWFTSSQTISSSGLNSSGLFNSPGAGLFGINNPAGSGFQSSQSSGFFAINQPPMSNGNGSFTAQKLEASGDADEENELEQPSSPSLKKTEEKGVVVVHKVKCKVYLKPDNPNDKGWKDMGVGELSIKCQEGAEKASKESKPTIIIRNDIGKILLNALIYPGIKMNIKKNTITSIFHTSNDGDKAVARTYLLRLKTEEETTTLATAIQDYAPSV